MRNRDAGLLLILAGLALPFVVFLFSTPTQPDRMMASVIEHVRSYRVVLRERCDRFEKITQQLIGFDPSRCDPVALPLRYVVVVGVAAVLLGAWLYLSSPSWQRGSNN
jgi:hypothetical protein